MEPVNAFEWVALPADVVIPQTIRGEAVPVPGLRSVVVDLEARWNPFEQEYDVIDLRITSHMSTEAITGTLLRQVPVRSLLREVVQQQARVYRGKGESEPVQLDRKRLRRLAEKGPKPETLDAVALVYTIAEAVLDSPAKRVREEFNLAPRTATHWIKLARERGHLPPQPAAASGSRAKRDSESEPDSLLEALQESLREKPPTDELWFSPIVRRPE